mmetsp:Transcript_452/g.814  ORF Transcript_452/g.814 Transcript_452/m.814 type:complete len:558 (+) Transcript_452:321-1994(+)
MLRRTLPLHSPRLIRLVSINDVYTLTNLPRLHTFLSTLSPPPSAVVLSGDFISPSTLSSIDAGVGMISTLRATGVTHLSFGNHEADFKLGVLKERVRSFRKSGEVLNSNMREGGKEGGEWLLSLTSPTSIITSQNLKVSLHGYISDEPNMFPSNTFKGQKISPVFSTYKDIVKNQPEVDLHVPMTHQSIGNDIAFARKIADMGQSTVIIGGHEHEKFDDLVQHNGRKVRIVKTGENAERAAVIDLVFGEVLNELLEVRVEFEEMSSYPPCPVVNKIASKHLSVIKSMEETSIITTALLPTIFSERLMSSERTRFRQTSVGAFICQSVKLELEVDCCIINGATIKGNASYPTGKMSYAELKKELPFPTKMVVVEMTRKVLDDAVKWSRENVEEGGVDETKPDMEVARRGYLQTDYDYEVGGEGDDDEILLVALPRNLMGGFCKIKPLMDFGEELKSKGIYPNNDSIIKAIDIVVRFCCKERWVNLSETATFDDLDLNHDGVLDASEIKNAMTTFLGEEPPDFFVEAMIESIDEDHNGTIEIEEFKQLMASVKRRKKGT